MPNGDYILRSDAIEIAMEWCPDDDGSVGKVGDLREMLDELESIPAADVAEVVYCSDCFYHYDDGDHKCKKLRIPCPDDSEFFCKYGKRKG